ncbi:MAG: hypothetical protein JHC95_23030, partial [Solirubrobacteraceae bacterium]|nr:hypothetical protein [Solirubrobacteraceae bacterium]
MRVPLSPLAVITTAIALAAPAVASAEVRPAKGSGAFVDSIGVNIHSSFGSNTPYYDHPKVLNALKSVGIRHVRDGLMTPNAPATVQNRQRQFRSDLAAAGIKSTLLMGDPNADAVAHVAAIKDEGSRTIAGLEGSNEWDLHGGATWAADVRAYQRKLFEAVRAQPSLNDVPVLGPSMGHSENAAQLGNVGAYTNFANMHLYPGGRAPGSFDDKAALLAYVVSGGQPGIVTETGYHNAVNQWTGGHAPTSERATAIYLPRLFLDNFRRGIARTFSYELLNTYSDTSKTYLEAHFGLFRGDYSEKPAAASLRNLIKLADGGEASDPGGSLDYTLAGNLSGVQQVLLRRKDGSYALALWQTASVWDATYKRELYPAARPVKLTLAAPADVSTGRPGVGTALTAGPANTTTADLSVPGDDVLMVVIRPTGAPVTPVTPPTSGGDSTT